MPAIPPNVVTPHDLIVWQELKTQLNKVKAAESLLRGKIFNYHFPNPEEGVNYKILEDGTKLKGTYPIDRKIDPAAWDAVRVMLEEEHKLKPNRYIDRKPTLKISEYRTLTEEERHTFDQALTIKPGSISIEIIVSEDNHVAGTFEVPEEN